MSLLFPLSQANVIPQCIPYSYLYTESSMWLSPLIDSFLFNSWRLPQTSITGQNSKNNGQPQIIDPWYRQLLYLTPWEMGFEMITQARTPGCLLTSRHDKNAAPMKSQQYGSLRKTHLNDNTSWHANMNWGNLTIPHH